MEPSTLGSVVFAPHWERILHHGVKPERLDYLRSLQILSIGGITPELLAEARRSGSEVWCYHHWLGRATPLANRYNTGLYTWGLGITGNYQWAYYYGGSDDYVLVKSADILPKPSYEGLREGIDDYRYLRLLQNCIAGLKSEDTYTRRAATAALALRGPEGAPAVPELIRQTKDPNLRMQTFRAIKAIGVPTATAVPTFEKYLRDQDGFVRLGAVFAFGGLGKSAVEPLSGALYGSDTKVVQAACAGLVAIGPAAKPAVPDLIVLLGGPNDNPRRHIGEMTVFHTYAAIQAITAIGPGAAAAVPALIEAYQRKLAGQKHFAAHAEALAAIGPAEAVPVLEEAARSYDWVNGPGLHAKGPTLYALYVIRGQETDLQSLADLLSVTEYNCGLKTARLLNNLGHKAR